MVPQWFLVIFHIRVGHPVVFSCDKAKKCNISSVGAVLELPSWEQAVLLTSLCSDEIADHQQMMVNLFLICSCVPAVITIVTGFSLTSNHEWVKNRYCAAPTLTKLKGLFLQVKSDSFLVSHWDRTTTGSSSFWTIYPMNSEGMMGLGTKFQANWWVCKSAGKVELG